MYGLLKEELLLLPEQIKKMELSLMNLKKQQDEHHLSVNLIKRTIENDILNDKINYPNEAKRKIEIQKRLEDATDYQEAMDMYNKTKEEMALLDIEITFFKNKLRSYESITRL